VTAVGALVAGRYRLRSELGGGGMGAVWLARDELLGRDVAVKQVLVPVGIDAELAAANREAAMREGRIAARLSHPHAVAVYDMVLDDGQPWLVMEYLPSRSLAALLHDQGVLPVPQVAQIGAQVADALTATHAAGVVHRDVKPGNILIGEGSGREGLVKITDFGISRAVGDVSLTQTGVVKGTPAFLAPEVAQGHSPDEASDVFSLGATLYACLEGTPPFGLSDNALQMLHRVAGGEFTPPQHAGVLTSPLMHMLAPDPATRPTMPQVRDELARIAAGPDRDPTEVLTARTPLPRTLPGMPAPGRRSGGARSGGARSGGASSGGASSAAPPAEDRSAGPPTPTPAAPVPSPVPPRSSGPLPRVRPAGPPAVSPAAVLPAASLPDASAVAEPASVGSGSPGSPPTRVERPGAPVGASAGAPATDAPRRDGPAGGSPRPPARPAGTPPPERWKRWPAALAGLVVLGVVAALLVVWLNRGDDGAPDGSSAGASSSGSESSASSSTTSSAAGSSSAPASSAAETSRAQSTTPSAAATTAPSSAPASSLGGAPTAADVQSAVTSYYALLPGNPQAAWENTGPTLRGAESFPNYVAFWSRFDAVRLGPVSVAAGSLVARAPVTFVENGSPLPVEQHTITLIRGQDGRLLIDSDVPG
jgi:serine/threonine protein kinase